MSKSAKSVFAAVVVGGVGLAFAAGESSADTPPCTEASCGRYILCPSTNWDMVGSVAANSAIYCRFPQRTAPTCDALNLRGDWVFDSTTKSCCRGAAGERTCSEKNIACSGAGHTYSAASGLCVGEPYYANPKATTAPGAWGTYGWLRKTVSEATGTLRCPAGYTLTFGTPTVPRYVCEKHESGQTSAAFCDGAGFVFNTTTKQCCRGTTCSTSNIVCQPGANYMSFKGSCVTPSTTVYAAPYFN